MKSERSIATQRLFGFIVIMMAFYGFVARFIPRVVNAVDLVMMVLVFML